jgi:hypothetical protein
MNGAFGVSTSLDISEVREAATRACEQFPVKSRKLLGDCKPNIQPDLAGQRT